MSWGVDIETRNELYETVFNDKGILRISCLMTRDQMVRKTMVATHEVTVLRI